jgi:dCMP deaminase|tara:strand:+ start:1276 stop:1749 length:474 start_codon:yes stop_codon:yes gene_type:complete
MDSKIRRLQIKLETFTEILKNIRDLSNSSTTKVGCIALRKDFSKIASFGYNGSYSGAGSNIETGTEEDSLNPGESGFIHAEVNMIAKFKEYDPENYIVLLTLSPCKMCTKILVNAGFKHVYWIDDYRSLDHLEIFKQCKITYGPISYLIDDYHLIKD